MSRLADGRRSPPERVRASGSVGVLLGDQLSARVVPGVYLSEVSFHRQLGDPAVARAQRPPGRTLSQPVIVVGPRGPTLRRALDLTAFDVRSAGGFARRRQIRAQRLPR